MNRTHYIGNLRSSHIGEAVNIFGWVKNHRDFGELIFVDIADIKGLSQVVFNNGDKELFELAKSLKNEDVINVMGIVKARQDVNKNIPTGEIEVIATKLSVVNRSEPVPIQVDDNLEASEETRLTYRYLDLRRPALQNNMVVRSNITKSVREFLHSNEFLEVETPILTKSTPEGARDFLVPSRVNEQMFFALPQSPQLYKNLLMISGFDRYFQIVKCFRDEDLRSDRQPEFTQIDLEMSFMSEREITNMMETMLKKVVKDVKGIELTHEFPVMTYKEAMDKYGVDKPDTRFAMYLNDVSEIFAESGFKVFKEADFVKCIKVSNGDTFSRKDIDKLEEVAKQNHAKGMAWLKYNEEEFTGPIAKFLSETEKENLVKTLELGTNELILFAADTHSVVSSSLGALRNHIANLQDLCDPNELAFCWVVDWPMFEYDGELNRYFAMHHPFTMPKNDEFLEDTLKTQAQAYDIVLNGYELGGGSIRINNPELQKQMFSILGFSDEEAVEQFGFMLDAYKYGAPYHGGIAFGLDRLAMILTNSDSIREVIAFPKNNKARELMMDSPARVTEEQLIDLHIGLRNE